MTATTPWPPAAQIEISPRAPEPFSCNSFAKVATIRPPVAANGWPVASDEPVTLSRSWSMDAQWRVQPQPVAAERLVLPRGLGRQHRGGEGLVDLDELEVLQLHPDPREQPGHGVRGRHQQTLSAVDVVDRRRLRVDEVRQRRQPVLRRPGVAAQQHGRGAVGERRRVAGGHRRALALAEHRRQRRQLLQGGVGAQVGVAGDPEVGRDEVVEEPAARRRRRAAGATAGSARPGPPG